MEKKQGKHIHDAFGGTLYRNLPHHSFLHVTRLQNVWFALVEAEKLWRPLRGHAQLGSVIKQIVISGVFDVI